MAGDSYFHMDLGRTFTTDNWFQVNAVDNLWVPTQFPFPEEYRPPFFNFILGFFYNIFETSFYISKLVNVLIGTLVIIPTYLIARKFGSERVALVVSALIAFNPIIIGHSLESEVRLITVYFALTSIYFFLKGKEFWAYSGIMTGLLYITHYAPATILIFSYLVHFLISARRQIFSKNTLVMALIALLVVSPWLARNYDVFGDPLHTSTRTVLFTTAFDQVFSLEKPTFEGYIDYIKNNPQEFIFTKVTNVYRSLFPLPFQSAQNNYFLNLNPVSNFNLILNPTSMVITLPVFLLALYHVLKSLWRPFKNKNSLDFLVLYIIMGFVISTIMWNTRTSFTYNFLFPQVFAFAILGVMMLEKVNIKYRKFIYVSIVALLLVQIPTYEIRWDVKTDYAQSWIVENTGEGDVIMARWTNVHLLNLLTDRKILSIPFEDVNTVVNYGRQHNASYLIVDRLDLDLGKYTLDDFNRTLEFIDVYKIPEPSFSREYANTYYIFKF
jgi:4-amino-4-deoxy-L-arabinose transferase-like glycosyltransferase